MQLATAADAYNDAAAEALRNLYGFSQEDSVTWVQGSDVRSYVTVDNPIAQEISSIYDCRVTTDFPKYMMPYMLKMATIYVNHMHLGDPLLKAIMKKVSSKKQDAAAAAAAAAAAEDADADADADALVVVSSSKSKSKPKRIVYDLDDVDSSSSSSSGVTGLASNTKLDSTTTTPLITTVCIPFLFNPEENRKQQVRCQYIHHTLLRYVEL